MEIYATITIDDAWAVYTLESSTDAIFTARLMRRSFLTTYYFAEKIILHKTNGEWFSDNRNDQLTEKLVEAIEREHIR